MNWLNCISELVTGKFFLFFFRRTSHTNSEEVAAFMQKEIAGVGQMDRARVLVVAPTCNTERICCTTRHNKKTDQVV